MTRELFSTGPSLTGRPMIAFSESQLISRPRPVRRHRCHWKLVAKNRCGHLVKKHSYSFSFIAVTLETADPSTDPPCQNLDNTLHWHRILYIEGYAFDLKWPISQRYPTTTQLPQVSHEDKN
jgi:hypothetical protein